MMSHDASTRIARTALGVCTVVLALASPSLRAQKAEPVAPPAPNYDLAAQWTSQKVGKLVFDTTRDAALARDQRSLLVRLPDARRPPVLPRRSGQEDEGAALRSREDGGHADLDHAHSLRRAAPAVLAPSASSRTTRRSSSTCRCRRRGASRRRRSATPRPSSQRAPRRDGEGRSRGSRTSSRNRSSEPARRLPARGARPAPRDRDAALRVRPGDRAGHAARGLQGRRRGRRAGRRSRPTARPSSSPATTTSS